MSEPMRVNTLGTRWEVDVAPLPPEIGDRLRALWSHTSDWTPDASEPEGFPRRLVARLDTEGLDGADAILLPADANAAPYAFSGALTVRAIQAQAGRLTMLHASSLALPQTGAAALLVAASGTGKTTAATRLGRDLNYLTDETAAVRDDLGIVPHPKPLSIVGDGGKHERSPAELMLLPCRHDAWVAASLLLDRVSGASAHLAPVPVIDAIIEAIPQSSSLPAQDQPFERLLAVFAAGQGVHRLVYSEIDDAVPVVHDLLQSASRGERTDLGAEVLSPPARSGRDALVGSSGDSRRPLPDDPSAACSLGRRCRCRERGPRAQRTPAGSAARDR